MARKNYLLAIDIGTSGAKAAIFDVDGNLISLRQEEYFFEHPKPGWSEINPAKVWQTVVQVVQQCVRQNEEASKGLVALGLSVLGETSMPVDGDGEPLYPAIEALDRRENAYQEYVSWFENRFGAVNIFKRTSYPLSMLPPPHKILWLRDHQPEIFSRTKQFVTFQDFTVWKLTGKPALDYSMASRTMLFDVLKKTWIPDYLSAMGVDETLFSTAYPASQPVSELKEEIALQIGLPSGMLVVPGAHDQSCAALGVGVVREGVASDGTGSVEAIATATRIPITSPEMLARGHGSQCHVTPDLYLALGFQLTAGSLVRWYRDQLAQWEAERADLAGVDPYDLITTSAQGSPPGANGLIVFPHWSGSGTGRVPALNPLSRGAVLGFTLGHTRADLNRAIFEGITLETRFIIESLESNGVSIENLVVTGGGAKSDFWLQLKADITGKRILVPAVKEASLLGAAILAGVGAGLYSNVESAVDKVCKTERVFEPDPERVTTYDQTFKIYEDVYDSIIPISEQLAQISEI